MHWARLSFLLTPGPVADSPPPPLTLYCAASDGREPDPLLTPMRTQGSVTYAKAARFVCEGAQRFVYQALR